MAREMRNGEFRPVRIDENTLLTEGNEYLEEKIKTFAEDCEKAGVEWKSIPEYITTNEDELYALGKQIKELQERYDTLKADLLAHMEADGLKSVDTGAVLITYVAPSSRETFDSKKFKAEHEEMYGDYVKKSNTKASLKITLR